MIKMSDIPEVDLKQHTSDPSTFGENTEQLSRELYDALSSFGWVVLKNSGITDNEMQMAFGKMKEFFELDAEVKSSYAFGDIDDMAGWRKEGAEVIDPSKNTVWDIREAYDIIPAHLKKWPDQVEMFKVEIMSFFTKAGVLASKLLELLAVALNLEDKHYFTKLHHPGEENNMTTLRLAYYPSFSHRQDLLPGQLWCGEHKDFTSISLIFQDDVAGLQMKMPDGSYASPSQNSVILLAGEFMEIWTSGCIKAPLHRVVSPNPELSRLSAVFFYQPDNDTILRCLDGSDAYEPRNAIDSYKSFVEKYGLDKKY